MAAQIMNAREARKLVAKPDQERERRERFERSTEAWRGWIERARQDEADDDDFMDDDLIALALAALHDLLDQHVAGITEQARQDTGSLRRAVAAAEVAHARERRDRAIETSVSRKRMIALERQARESADATAELRKLLAGLQREIARDRAQRRLADARRTYPHAQQADLLRARRATDRAIGGNG